MKRVIPFTKYRHFAYALSALLFIGFIAGTVARGGINWGIDFAGGVKLTAKFDGDVTTESIKDHIEKQGISASVQQIGEPSEKEFIIFSKLIDKKDSQIKIYDFMNSEFGATLTPRSLCEAISADKYSVTMTSPEGSIDWLNELLKKPEFFKSWKLVKKDTSSAEINSLAAELENVNDFATNDANNEKLIKLNRLILEKTYREKTPVNNTNNGSSDISYSILWKAITKEYPSANRLSVETVGPAIGDYLRKSAIKLGIIAILMMTVYLAFRFEFKYSLGAMLALLHDVAVCFFLCGVLRIEMDIPIVAALLTIFGYSVNDTIVVFDRIRENINAKASPKFSTIINMSATSTLSRTILTSLLTSFAVISILIFGGPSLKNFAIVLLFGIAVGTFSSIFVASPIVMAYEKYIKKNKDV